MPWKSSTPNTLAAMDLPTLFANPDALHSQSLLDTECRLSESYYMLFQITKMCLLDAVQPNSMKENMVFYSCMGSATIVAEHSCLICIPNSVNLIPLCSQLSACSRYLLFFCTA